MTSDRTTNPNWVHVYAQCGRPPQSKSSKQPSKRIVGLALAKELPSGDYQLITGTGYSQSDDGAVIMAIAELINSDPSTKYIAHIAIHGVLQQLVYAEAATKRGNVNASGKTFNAIEDYRIVLSAIAKGYLQIVFDEPNQRDSEGYRRAFEEAHGRAVRLAVEHAKRDSTKRLLGRCVNLLLSWDGELFFLLIDE